MLEFVAVFAEHGIVVVVALVPQVHGETGDRPAVTVPDDVDGVVVVLAVTGILLAELGFDRLLEADCRRPALLVTVAAGPVVLRVVQLIERHAALA